MTWRLRSLATETATSQADAASPRIGETAATSTAGSGVRGAWLRRHGLFLVALVLGVAIRALVVVAYRPALIFTDSFAYLRSARDLQLLPSRPIGYSFFLRPFELGLHQTSALAAIQVSQHVIALALACAIYVFLLRRGLPGWAATLGTVPLLLDPLELVMEHYILSDFLFAVLLVLAILTLFWRHRPGVAAVAATGALIGCAVLVRGAGTFLVAAFLVGLICLRVPWHRVVVFLVAAGLPIAAYAAAFEHEHGKFATTTSGPYFLYARIAPIVNCADPQLHLTPRERQLCPSQPVAHRPDTNFYMWSTRTSPLYTVKPPRGETRQQFVGRFDKLVVRSQPVTYARAVLKDFSRAFAPTRTEQAPGYPASYWLFADHYWTWDSFANNPNSDDPILQHVSAEPGAARFMAAYGRHFYLPGPLAALLLLCAVIATLGFGRARRSANRVLIGTTAGSCLLVMATGAALSGFSWRYQLPQITLVPIAGVLAIAALVRRPDPASPAPMPPIRPLDRGAAVLGRLPLPARGRALLGRAIRSGVAQTVLAMVVGLASALLVAAAGVASGYLRPLPALGCGLGCGIVVFLILVVARARAARDERGGAQARSVVDEG